MKEKASSSDFFSCTRLIHSLHVSCFFSVEFIDYLYAKLFQYFKAFFMLYVIKCLHTLKHCYCSCVNTKVRCQPCSVSIWMSGNTVCCELDCVGGVMDKFVIVNQWTKFQFLLGLLYSLICANGILKCMTLHLPSQDMG